MRRISRSLAKYRLFLSYTRDTYILNFLAVFFNVTTGLRVCNRQLRRAVMCLVRFFSLLDRATYLLVSRISVTGL